MKLWFLGFGADRAWTWALEFKARDPVVVPIHLSCPRQTPDPISTALPTSGGFRGDVVRSRWLTVVQCGLGMGAPSPLDLPPIPSDSLKICSLQGLGVRLDLSPWLVLPPSPLTTLVSQLYPAKALLSPRSQRPLALRYLKRGPASG